MDSLKGIRGRFTADVKRVRGYIAKMNRNVLLTGAFLATLGAGAYIGHVTSDLVGSKSELRREHAQQVSVLEQKIDAQHEAHLQEIAELTAENQQIQSNFFDFQDTIEVLDDKMVDQEFLLAHAALQLKKAKGEPPEYDWDRFIKKNPETKKYFPYLLDAVERYKDIWPVDPMFALAIMKQESRFGKYIISKAGALGDAQFIESTWNSVSRVKADEPYTWSSGRRQYSTARSLRSDARGVRDVFLDRMLRGLDLSLPSNKIKEQLISNFSSNAWRLESYYRLLDDAERRVELGDEAFKMYEQEIKLALSKVPEIEREVRKRQVIDDEMIYVSGVRAPKTAEEKQLEVDLAVNHYIMQVDPRLSTMLFIDALVHHLADLFFKFNGDERFVSSRYNASGEAMRRPVRSEGGVGIPLIYETMDYVNMIQVFRAKLAYDAGIVDRTFDITCCHRYATSR